MIPSTLFVEFAKGMLNLIFLKGTVTASKIIDDPEMLISLKRVFPEY